MRGALESRVAGSRKTVEQTSPLLSVRVGGEREEGGGGRRKERRREGGKVEEGGG